MSLLDVDLLALLVPFQSDQSPVVVVSSSLKYSPTLYLKGPVK